MKEIPLTGKYANGRYVIVDDEDYNELIKRSWWCDKEDYAKAKISGKSWSMHRLLMDAPKGMEVDHINHNTLDNQKTNLRIVTPSQNQANSISKHNSKSSIYKGVSRKKAGGAWNVYIQKDDELLYLGCYNDEVEASRAYDVKAIELFGEFAYLNHKDFDYSNYIPQPNIVTKTSKYIGVYSRCRNDRQIWCVSIMKKGEHIYNKEGFLTEDDAMLDREKYIVENCLDWCKLNCL